MTSKHLLWLLENLKMHHSSAEVAEMFVVHNNLRSLKKPQLSPRNLSLKISSKIGKKMLIL